jgi:SAM-dependent methyltransferase
MGKEVVAGEDDRYFKTTREDLLRTLKDPSRVKGLIDIVAQLEVKRVLDVGCGVGQALFPLAVSQEAFGVGVDISETACRMGREIYAEHLPKARVTFVCSRAESLPFASASFDLVNCGLALPYTNNARAIGEIARVLRPGGAFLLKIHHARYYLRELWRALISHDFPLIVYAGRVLVSGTIYHLIRRQPGHRLFNESFQTERLLRWELAKHRITIAREQPSSNPQTPAYVMYKEQSNQ